MKKTFLFLGTALALLITTNLTAQVEAKINPLGALFGSPDISIEYGVSESFGVEGALAMNFNKYTFDAVEYRNTGAGIRVAGKYYFSPKNGFDKWYGGVYTKFKKGTAKISDNSTTTDKIKSTRFALGFLFGHKWVTKHNIVFELNGGFGRAFIAKYEAENGETVDASEIPLLNWDVIGTFAVGYRFGGKKAE